MRKQTFFTSETSLVLKTFLLLKDLIEEFIFVSANYFKGLTFFVSLEKATVRSMEHKHKETLKERETEGVIVKVINSHEWQTRKFKGPIKMSLRKSGQMQQERKKEKNRIEKKRKEKKRKKEMY